MYASSSSSKSPTQSQSSKPTMTSVKPSTGAGGVDAYVEMMRQQQSLMAQQSASAQQQQQQINQAGRGGERMTSSMGEQSGRKGEDTKPGACFPT
jgi:hypothetical protein